MALEAKFSDGELHVVYDMVFFNGGPRTIDSHVKHFCGPQRTYINFFDFILLLPFNFVLKPFREYTYVKH